jgi:hypothetical protein
MPDESTTTTEDKAPYISLTTLTNFLDRIGDGPIPPRIDKSALDNYSGGTQAILMSTLRLMGFVGPDGQVLNSLRESVRDTEYRRQYLVDWAGRFYAPQLQLAEQGATAQMLHESFANFGYNGSTLRKAIVFYLALVDYLGLPTSPFFKAPKQSATPPARRRPRATPNADEILHQAFPPPTPRAPAGEVTTVNIEGLATITIVVDAQWMKLPVETITSMREAIGQLEALGTSDPEPS